MAAVPQFAAVHVATPQVSAKQQHRRATHHLTIEVLATLAIDQALHDGCAFPLAALGEPRNGTPTVEKHVLVAVAVDVDKQADRVAPLLNAAHPAKLGRARRAGLLHDGTLDLPAQRWDDLP
jgi:hypothetical protein